SGGAGARVRALLSLRPLRARASGRHGSRPGDRQGADAGDGRAGLRAQRARAADGIPGAAAIGSGVGARARESRQAVVRELGPDGCVGDERAILRPQPGFAVERAEADRDFRSVGPRAAEEARAADLAERLDGRAVGGPVRADEVRAREQSEALARDSALREAERSRMPPAARAVAV